MNRKLRRTLSKKGMVENIVAGAITETQHQIRVDTVRDLTLINLMVLHDKFGFGGKRIKKFHQELANLSDCLTKGFIKIEEIAEILDVECGVKL